MAEPAADVAVGEDKGKKYVEHFTEAEGSSTSSSLDDLTIVEDDENDVNDSDNDNHTYLTTYHPEYRRNSADDVDTGVSVLAAEQNNAIVSGDQSKDDVNNGTHAGHDVTIHTDANTNNVHGAPTVSQEPEKETSVKSDFSDVGEHNDHIEWDDILSRAGIINLNPQARRRLAKGRVRTLSRISEGSHASNTSIDHSPVIPRQSSDTGEGHCLSDSASSHSLSDSDHDSDHTRQAPCETLADGRVKNTSLENLHQSHTKQEALPKVTVSQSFDGSSDVNDSAIVSGNIRNMSGRNTENSKVGGLESAETLNMADITKSSTPQPSHQNQKPFQWPDDSRSTMSSADQMLPRSFSNPVLGPNQPQASHDTVSSGQHPASDQLPSVHPHPGSGQIPHADQSLPSSLQNLAFLVHPSIPVSDVVSRQPDSFPASFSSNSRNGVRRSNLKRPLDVNTGLMNIGGATPRPTPRPTINTDPANMSPGGQGGKKSITWMTDLRNNNRGNRESTTATSPEYQVTVRAESQASLKSGGLNPVDRPRNWSTDSGTDTPKPRGGSVTSETSRLSDTPRLRSTTYPKDTPRLKDTSFTELSPTRDDPYLKQKLIGSQKSDVTLPDAEAKNIYRNSSPVGLSPSNKEDFTVQPAVHTSATSKVQKNLKGGKVRGIEKEFELTSVDDDLMSIGGASSLGRLSSACDLSPKGSMYLTDAEDTVTSYDQVVNRREMAANGAGAGDSVFSDEVFKPFTPLVKKKDKDEKAFFSEALRNALLLMLSGLYGVLLVVLGLVLPISETFADPSQPLLFEMFYLYLYAVSLVFLVYVYSYLLRKEQLFRMSLTKTLSRTFSRTFSRTSQRSRHPSDISGPQGNGSNMSTTTTNRSHINSSSRRGLVRDSSCSSILSRRSRRRKIAYNAETSNHTGSFYLRVGVIGFGIGSMIHSGLLFGHYFEINHLTNHCSSLIQAIKPFAHLCFTFVQMYFVFMNSKMCVHKYKTLARFGLMHMSCTNICVWLRSIVVETLHVIKIDERKRYDAMMTLYNAEKYNVSIAAIAGRNDSMALEDLEDVEELEELLYDQQEGSLPELNCHWNTGMMGMLVEKASVYLYPCTIEYSLVCACVLYVMWSNVGEGKIKPKNRESCSDSNAASDDDSDEEDRGHHRMSVDCAGSSKGLFLGIMLFVASVVCLVCFYVLINAGEGVTSGTLVGHISEDVTYILAFIATAMAAFQMRGMHYSVSREVGLEEILSLISLTGLGLYAMFSIVAAIFYLHTMDGPWTIVTNTFMVVQAGSQVCFTLAALRASAINNEQLRTKPGRQCVTFLLICNFALWAINTFETQRLEHNLIQTGRLIQADFYGPTAWSIFSHISVPLGIYFRFHSTVNLSIVWKKAWKIKHAQPALK